MEKTKYSRNEIKELIIMLYENDNNLQHNINDSFYTSNARLIKHLIAVEYPNVYIYENMNNTSFNNYLIVITE